MIGAPTNPPLGNRAAGGRQLVSRHRPLQGGNLLTLRIPYRHFTPVTEDEVTCLLRAPPDP
jgi:hypothetical protein